jgi:CubicO group peptidase (beta-lactamase class C family)
MITNLHLRVLLVASLLAVAPSAQAQVTRAALVARLDSMAGSGVVEGRTAGLYVAVVRGNDTLLLKGYGKANIERNQSTPERAVYELASMTKQFTAAAILQLRDAGKLSLDDDLTKYLPSFPTRGRRIPIRSLLNHTSGIDGELAAFGPISRNYLGQDSVLAAIGRAPFQFPTGEAMIYSNSAFILLGHVIEKASGMTYERYIEDKIFAPLGMRDSRFSGVVEEVPRRTTGYRYQSANSFVPDQTPRNYSFSAGTLASTAGDMVTWLHALHGGKVLSPASYTEMTSPSRLNDGTPLRYGYGLSVDRDIRGPLVIGHGGGIVGFTSYSGWYPDAQLVVVVLANSNGGISPEAIASELAGEIIPPARPVMRPYTGTDGASFSGVYVGPSRGREMVAEVTMTPQGILRVSPNSAAAQPLSWIQGSTFGRTGSVMLTFVRSGTTGPVTELRFDAGGGLYILKRVGDAATPAPTPTITVDPATLARYAGEYTVTFQNRSIVIRYFVEGGELFGQVEGQDPLAFDATAERVFVARMDPDIKVTFTVENGVATKLSLEQAGQQLEGVKKP